MVVVVVFIPLVGFSLSLSLFLWGFLNAVGSVQQWCGAVRCTLLHVAVPYSHNKVNRRERKRTGAPGANQRERCLLMLVLLSCSFKGPFLSPSLPPSLPPSLHVCVCVCASMGYITQMIVSARAPLSSLQIVYLNLRGY